jgi:hypothetical protein
MKLLAIMLAGSIVSSELPPGWFDLTPLHPAQQWRSDRWDYVAKEKPPCMTCPSEKKTWPPAIDTYRQPYRKR